MWKKLLTVALIAYALAPLNLSAQEAPRPGEPQKTADDFVHKPVECMQGLAFVKAAIDNGFEPLIGGLGQSDIQLPNDTFKLTQVMVVWWINQDNGRWVITELDKKKELCVVGRGEAANFDIDQIKEVIASILTK